MTTFKRPVRYDHKRAEDGVWFPVVDEFGNDYGSYKLRYLDPYSPRTSATLKAISARYGDNFEHDEESNKALFVETSLADWKGVVDADDQPVPFSIEAANAYLDMSVPEMRWLLIQLNGFSADVKKFGLENVGKTAKN